VISVAIVEDEPEIRDGLSALIADTPGFRMTGKFPSAEEALSSIASDVPDVVLMDLGLPGMSGSEAILALKARHPELQYLVLTAFESDDHVFAAMCAGACGYLVKRASHQQIVNAIQELTEGGAPMSPRIARQVVRLFQTCTPPAKLRCSSFLWKGIRKKRPRRKWGFRSIPFRFTAGTSTKSCTSTRARRQCPRRCGSDCCRPGIDRKTLHSHPV
jgi:DNA-binding NarL/FixJ family response regulator